MVAEHKAGLGKLFNVVGSASDAPVSLKRGEGVTFVSYAAGGNQVVSLVESIDGASEQALARIDTAWKSPGAGGTWAKVTQTAAASITHADGTNNVLLFTITADQLSDGYTAVKATTTTGDLYAIVHGLDVGADPELLPSPAPTGPELLDQSTAWYSTDGIGESDQELDNRGNGTAKATLGATTGAEASDPEVLVAGREKYVTGLFQGNSNTFTSTSVSPTTPIELDIRDDTRQWPTNQSAVVRVHNGSYGLNYTDDGTVGAFIRISGGSFVTVGAFSGYSHLGSARRQHRLVANSTTGLTTLYYRTKIQDLLSDDDWIQADQTTETYTGGFSFSVDPYVGGSATLLTPDRIWRAVALYDGVLKVDFWPDRDIGDGIDDNQNTWVSASTGKTWTVNRHATGLKAAVVKNRSLLMTSADATYLTLPTELTPDETPTAGALTVAAAIRTTGAVAATFDRIYSSETANNNGIHLTFDTNGHLEAFIGDGSTTTAANLPGTPVIQGNEQLEVVALVIDTDGIAVYHHGTGRSTFQTFTEVPTHGQARIGAAAYADSSELAAEVYDFAQFDRPLTTAELDALAAYWKAQAA